MEALLAEFRAQVGPYYLQIKFVHLFFVMIWGWSTAVAYGWYVKLAYRSWERHPDDPDRKRRRDWTLEQFDQGAILEHIAFPVVLFTGLALLVLGGWPLRMEVDWLTTKLAIVLLIFIPMEIVDIWLAHGGGNLARIRESGDAQRYEQGVARHWAFLQISTPIVITAIPFTIYLVVVKPF